MFTRLGDDGLENCLAASLDSFAPTMEIEGLGDRLETLLLVRGRRWHLVSWEQLDRLIRDGEVEWTGLPLTA